MSVMEGTCHEFVLQGTDATSICEPSIVNFAYRSGKSSFQFVLRDRAVIGFFGADEAAVGNSADLLIERISLNLLMGTETQSIPATGRCTYSHPYAGPSVIRCNASTEVGEFKAVFVSDGREPEIQEF